MILITRFDNINSTRWQLLQLYSYRLWRFQHVDCVWYSGHRVRNLLKWRLIKRWDVMDSGADNTIARIEKMVDGRGGRFGRENETCRVMRDDVERIASTKAIPINRFALEWMSGGVNGGRISHVQIANPFTVPRFVLRNTLFCSLPELLKQT